MPRFFERGDPAERAQRDLEAQLKSKIEQRDTKGVQLQAAESTLGECRLSVEQLALGADEAALDRALQSRRAAEDKLAALRGAALKIGKEISDIEAQIDKVVDQRVRHETSQAVDAMSTRLSKAASTFDGAAKELEAAAREILIIPEAQAVAEFTKSMHTQIPVAVEMIVVGLKGHARGVLSGHAPASLPRPAPPPVKLAIVPAPEATVNIFALKNLKFVNREGGVTTICKNKRHDLPKALAELALSTNSALPLSDQQRIRDLEYNAPAFHVPDPSACTWLGEKGPETPVRSARPGGPPIHSSLTEFTPMDRGPAYKVPFSRPPEPEPMAAARSMPDDDA
jgi:hypothetical protein